MKLYQRGLGPRQDAVERFFCKHPPKTEKTAGRQRSQGEARPKLPGDGILGGLIPALLPTARLCFITTIPPMLNEGWEDGDLPGMLPKSPASLCQASTDLSGRSPRCQDWDGLLRGSGGNKPHGSVGGEIPSVLGGRQPSLPLPSHL